MIAALVGAYATVLLTAPRIVQEELASVTVLPDFVSATNKTFLVIEHAFALINANHKRTALSKRTVKYLKTGRPDLSPVDPWLSPFDIRVRLNSTKLVHQYAKVLSTYSNTDSRDGVQKTSYGIAHSLSSVNLGLVDLDDDQLSLPGNENVQEVVNAIRENIIDQTLERDLPSIIDHMHPVIEKLVLMIKADIGMIKTNPPPTKEGICGARRNGCGMRRMLQILVENDNLVRENILMMYSISADEHKPDTLGEVDLRRRLFEEWIDTATSAHLQDGVLASLSATLDQFLLVHKALRQPKQQSTRVAVDEFKTRAESLAPLFNHAFMIASD